MYILKVWQLTLILANEDPLGAGHIEKKASLTLFLVMGKYDFWPVQCFLNGQKWGVKKQKLLSMSILKVWQLTLILAKQDPLGKGHIEKKGFSNTLLMRKHDFWPVQCFLNGQKWGVKNKSFSLCPFWRFDNWLLFWQNKTPWEEGHIEKKGFSNTLLMRKHDFWPVQCFLNGQKWGVKNKSFSLCPFWRFDNWLLFWQNKSPWEEVI